MKRFCTLFLSITAAFLLSIMASCRDFEGEQTVPAYIRIDTVSVSCDYYTYGANTHNITDAWVYVDDNILGCFELPATFPVLKEGRHKIMIRPGIKVNGIAYSRSWYQFMDAVVFNDVQLTRDSVTVLQPVFNYLPNGQNLHVRWMEDFDGGSVTLAPTPQSNVTSITRVSDATAWHDPNGIYSTYSGRVVLTSDTLQFCFATSEEFKDLPTTGSACMLEMDYKCSDTCHVGLYVAENGITDWGLVRLRPTCPSGEVPTTWNKVYINVGPSLVDNEDATYFKLYVSSWSNRNDGEQYFYFDNLKLMYRDR